MTKRWGWVMASLVIMVASASAQRERAQLWCEQGGQTVTVNGVVSSTKVQKSYPSCTVTVYDNATSNLTTICQDAACTTPLANPFTSTTTGYITFFAQTEPHIVDVQQSGAGLTTPITTRGLELCDIFTCLGGGGGGGGGTVSGTPPHIAKFTSPTSVGDSVGQDNGTDPTTWPLGLSLVTNALYVVKPNEVSTGTTVNLLVARASAGDFAIQAQPTDTNNLIGIAGVGAGTTGSVSIAIEGSFPCTFDGQTAFNDWVILGSGSQCHDAGAVEPPGIQNIGRVTSVNAGAGTLALVDVGLPDVTTNNPAGGSGVVGPCATFPGPIAYYTAVQTITCDPQATLDGAGNYTGQSATYTGTGAGFVSFGQGTVPSFSTINSFYFYAPSSIVTSIGEDVVAGSKRVCMMIFGSENGTALANADIGPQLEQCQIPYSATVYEVDVTANAGTPNVIVGVRHCTADPCAANSTVTNLVSSALATATSGGAGCSKTGATAGVDTFTTCAATLQNTTVAPGDYLETVSSTAGGVATRFSVAIHLVVN